MSPEAQELTLFLGFFVDHYMNIPAELHPLNFVRETSEKAPSRAPQGLRMAVNDCIEMSSHWDEDRVKMADDALKAHGIVTLSEIRRRYWRRFKAILKRGKIRNEEEYYLVKAISLDASPRAAEVSVLALLLEEYEGGVMLAVSKDRKA
jgi:hypothetical protein